jgi:sodium/potassium-transporting ATPase subunit alpha
MSELIEISVDENEHQMEWETFSSKKYFSKDHGLNQEQVQESIDQWGRNSLSEKEKTPAWLRFLGEFKNLFSLLLQLASVLCFVGYGLDTSSPDNLYLGIVLYAVVIMTSIFSFYQDSKSQAIMDGFKNMIPTIAKVIRDGKYIEIPSDQVVVGDTIIIKNGDKVNADIRLFETNDLKVDNSILTGESEPQSRSPNPSHSNVLESKNMLFYGTLIVEGEGKGIVMNVGDKTEMGKIADLAVNTQNVETPIHREIKYFVKIISGIAITLGVIFFTMGMIRDDATMGMSQDVVIRNIINGIGIIVANVPEGLLATVTIILALSAKQMANKNVLVKNLEAVESLGSTSVICTDKTGTLTMNKLSTSHICYNGEITEVKEDLKDKYDRNLYWYKFLQIGLQSNQAQEVEKEENGKLVKSFTGNASDIALRNFIGNFCEEIDYEKIFEIPFDSKRKWHLKVCRDKERLLFFLKGAPERVLMFCDSMVYNNEIRQLNEETNKVFDDMYEYFASKGERVLGFGFKELKYEENVEYNLEKIDELMKNLCFYGAISFQDPPRDNVPWAVEECQSAGVKVVMVTGDHPLTAKSIGEQVGILDKKKTTFMITPESVVDSNLLENIKVNENIVIVGEIMKKIEEECWEEITNKNNIVFARTSPEQKLQIVEKFQNKREIVAVTGDGVNDSPALKKADIGIAMGINGSDVSKETADMVLLDDNFASIVNGIIEGRRVFENLKKSIAYTLSSNIPEIFPFIIFMITNIPLPLTTVLILFIDLCTDMIPAISFAWEATESDLMKQKPRKLGVDRLVDARLISFSYLQIGVIQALAGFMTYFYVMDDHGFPIHILGGLGTYFGEKDLYCKLTSSGGLDTCGFSSGNGYELWRTASESADALAQAQTAYFISIIIVQVADMLICKTRRISLFMHKHFNKVSFFGFFSELAFGVLIAYAPFLNKGLGTQGISGIYWLIPIPFAVVIFGYDELRKFILRKYRENSTLQKWWGW